MKMGKIDRNVLAALSRTKIVKGQVRKVANEIRREARALAPRDTGDLVRGIAVDNVLDDRGQVEFRVGWSGEGFYGGLVELGTVDTPPQPHLRPAAIKVAGGSGRRIGGRR